MTTAPSVISVVDDDPFMRESLEGLMRAAGFVTLLFASGELFLESGAAAQTRCLVLDVDMPGMTGPQLQRELLSRAHGFPVIFITAHRNEQLREHALANGAAAFLHKPFDDDALLREISAAAGGG